MKLSKVQATVNYCKIYVKIFEKNKKYPSFHRSTASSGIRKIFCVRLIYRCKVKTYMYVKRKGESKHKESGFAKEYVRYFTSVCLPYAEYLSYS